MTAVAVNDAPMATNLSAGETYTEDTALESDRHCGERRGQRQCDGDFDAVGLVRRESQYRHLGSRDLDL